MKQKKRILKFSYRLYGFLLIQKFLEVTMKKFIKFVLFSRDNKKRRFFWERLGVLSNIEMTNDSGRWVWVHANSIGEVNACRSLICLIKDKYPTKRVLLTTANFSADQRAAELNIADVITFFPYDIPLIIKKYLKIFKPICIIVIECDIWPNFVRICKNKGIPVLVASGVYTNGYSRSLGLRHLYNYTFRLSRDVFENVDYFCMQSEDDAKRLSSVIPSHKNISVAGNLKFSYLNYKSFAQEKSYYQRHFNIKDTDSVFIAGNLHPGEDEMVIDAFMLVKERISDAIMILAPRFVEDVSYVESLLIKKRLNYTKKTELDKQKRIGEDIILLDTMGELAEVYSVAQVAFVGGSLIYLGEMFGGHNILEPAQFGIPVIFGPYMHNFRMLADLFLYKRIGIEVKDVSGLANTISDLMKDEIKRETIKLKAKEIFKANENVAEKTFEFLLPFLNSSHGIVYANKY